MTPLTRELRCSVAFAGLALVAGFLLFPLAQETDRFFSWTIQPPLTAAFMGAAYWAAFVLIGWRRGPRDVGGGAAGARAR